MLASAAAPPFRIATALLTALASRLPDTADGCTQLQHGTVQRMADVSCCIDAAHLLLRTLASADAVGIRCAAALMGLHALTLRKPVFSNALMIATMAASGSGEQSLLAILMRYFQAHSAPCPPLLLRFHSNSGTWGAGPRLYRCLLLRSWPTCLQLGSSRPPLLIPRSAPHPHSRSSAYSHPTVRSPIPEAELTLNSPSPLAPHHLAGHYPAVRRPDPRPRLTGGGQCAAPLSSTANRRE